MSSTGYRVSILMMILFGVLLLFTGAASACDFPYYMQTNSTDREWRTRIKQQFTRFPVVVTVDGNVMRTVSSDTEMRSHTRVCLQSLGQEKFLVAHESNGQDGTRYTCVKFVQVTSNVVQLQEAEISTRMDSSLCQDSNLTVNPWLLVDKNHIYESKPVQCGLQGGFSVRIYDSARYTGMCDSYQGETRMESECVRGEGLTFYFRLRSCVPQGMYMDITQETECLANWEYGPVSFMMLKHKTMKYIWVMRLPTGLHDNFVGFVFYDLKADASSQITGQMYMRLDAVRDIPLPKTALCVDDYEMCSYYSSPCTTEALALTCPRTCRLCNSTRPALCTLDSRYMGQWYNAANPGTLALTVNTTFLTTFDEYGYQERFHCVEWDANAASEKEKYRNTRMLVTDFTNGCKPRYSCVSFLQKASSVLFVKLSEGKSWPVTSSVTEPVDCSNFQYQEDTTLVPNMFKNDNYRLVYSRTSNSVPCDLPSGLTNYAATFKDGSNCTASLQTNTLVNGFTVVLNKCPDNILDTSHTCVESSRLLPSSLLIVTRSARDPDRIFCWVFPRGSQHNDFYLLQPSHCNESIKRRIRKGRVRALASFTKTRRTKNGQSRPSTTSLPALAVSSFAAPVAPNAARNTTRKISMDDRVGGSTTPTHIARDALLNDTAADVSEDETGLTATPFVIIAAIIFFLVFQIPCTCKSS